MAYVWQRWLADEYRKAGLKVVEVFGWENRGRPASTGNFNPQGPTTDHHTGSTTSASKTMPTLRTLIQGRPDLPGPLSQVGIGYDGTVYVIAAGRANHAGRVGKSGAAGMPLGADGNALAIGQEVDTNGTQAMPKAQRDALATVNAVNIRHYKRGTSYIHRHKDISGTGKWDLGSRTTSQLRLDAAAEVKRLSTPPPPPVTTHTRWAIRTTGVHDAPGGKKLRDIPAGYKFQVVDGSGHGNDGWIETAAGNWVLGADTTTRDPALPATLKVMTWNVKTNRSWTGAVLPELLPVLDKHKPDVVCLQECYDAPDLVGMVPGYTFRYQGYGYPPKTEGYIEERSEQIVLVRDGVEVKVKAALEMVIPWRGPVVGAMHDPRVHRRVTVFKDGVNWRVVGFHGPFGDALGESNAAMLDCLKTFPADEPVIIVGDWNQSNSAVVTRVGAPGGAVVDGGGIDLAVFRDCRKVKGENLGNFGSDHPVKVWTFEA